MDVSKKRLTGKLHQFTLRIDEKRTTEESRFGKILYIKLSKKCFDHSEGQYLVKLINIKWQCCVDITASAIYIGYLIVCEGIYDFYPSCVY